MPNDRETILARVRQALAPLPHRTALPDLEANLTVMRHAAGDRDWLAVFTERLTLVNGSVERAAPALAARLRAGGWVRGYCDPELWPGLAPAFGDAFHVEFTLDRRRIDDYQFGITRAAGAIAETGTIILSDALTSNRLAALAPWVHIAVVPAEKIYPDIGAALQGLGQDPNIIWVTGPSRTADVEGILIRGVHGPGQQIAFIA